LSSAGTSLPSSSSRLNLPALLFKPAYKPVRADPVGDLEQAFLPGVTKPHGLVGGGHVVGDLGDQGCRIAQQLRQHAPAVLAGLVRIFQQLAQILGRSTNAFQPGAQRRGELAGSQVDGLFLAFAALAVQAVEAALALAPRVALGDQMIEQRDIAFDRMVGVGLGQRRRHLMRDRAAEVESHQIQQPEHAGLGDAHGAAHDGVGLFDGQPALDGFGDRAFDPEHAQPVGDEARGVFRIHHALAEPAVAEIANCFNRFRPGFRTLDELQQPHVARRVEEMGDQEAGGEIVGEALGQGGQRNRGGIGTNYAIWRFVTVYLLVNYSFYTWVLYHRLYDPVAAGELVEVVLQVAGRHQPGVALMHEGRGIRAFQPFQRGLGDGAAPVRGGILRHDVQQQHGDPRIGDMGRDSTPHNARADDGYAIDFHG
jgi:hypothetical protein